MSVTREFIQNFTNSVVHGLVRGHVQSLMGGTGTGTWEERGTTGVRHNDMHAHLVQQIHSRLIVIGRIQH